ncbi:hypothetical protein [Rugamonas sp.]|uniref:hypothetical protein n=1 Tax=Rugamonas sp. TaxID=1926287 RepID=UPI0025E0380F|nr:hypothetical protein [Rugamonas sp.]
MNDQDLKQLWKTQPAAAPHYSEQQLRQRARSLHRRVAVRNFLEYAAGVAVIAGFAYFIAAYRHPLMQIGSALIIVATFFVLHQLHWRASGRPLPGADAALPGRAFHRAQLTRQRDALRTVGRWYVAPFVPGVVMFRWGVETQMAGIGPFAHGPLANALIAAVLLLIVGINWRMAGKLQGEIDALDHDTAA